MDLVTMILACSLASDNAITQAMIEMGSQNKPLLIKVVGGESKTLPTEAAAINYANKELQQGHAINIGLMQIPDRWLAPYHLNVADMFRPCKNMVVATRIVNDMREQCLSMKRTPPISNMQACALSMYATGNPEQGMDYANKVIDYAQTHPFVIPEPKIGQPKPKPDPVTPAATTVTSASTDKKPAATDTQNPPAIVVPPPSSADQNGQY